MTSSNERTMTIADLLTRVNGRLVGVAAIEGIIQGVCTLDEPKSGCLAFSRAGTGRELAKAVTEGKIAAVLIGEGLPEGTLPAHGVFIKVKDPQRAFIDIIPFFHQPVALNRGISSKADIDPSAQIGKNVHVGAFAVIGAGAVIGDDVTIHPQVVIYPEVTIGARTVLHAGAVIRERVTLGPDGVIQPGAVIGADGFGYIPDKELGLRAVPQVGSVELGPRVEIGANSCIDRGALGATRVGRGTKIDNQVQIGHNVQIGECAIICGQVGIGGSATIGSGTVLAGQVGVADHIFVAGGTRVGGGSIVIRDCPKPATLAGHPAVEAGQWKRAILGLYRGAKPDKKVE